MTAVLADVLSVLPALALVGLACTSFPGWLRTVWGARRAAGGVAAIALVALVLRGVVPAGPAALRSPLEDSAASGDTWLAIVRMLWRLTGPSDQVVFALNVALGSLAVCGMYAVACRLRYGPVGALLSAVALAVSPAHVRLSHSDSAGIAMVAALVWGLAAIGSPAGRSNRLAAGLALGVAASLRADGLLALPLAALMVWTTRPVDRDDGWVLVGFVVSLPALLLALPSWLAHPVAPDLVRPLVLVPPLASIPALLGLLALPLAHEVPLRSRVFVGLWVVVAVLGACVAPGAGVAALDSQLVVTGGQALAIGGGLAWLGKAIHRRSSTGAAVAGLVAVALLVPTRWGATRPTSLQQEYDFVRTRLKHVEDGCVILTWSGGTGPLQPGRLSEQQGRDHTWVDLAVEDQPLGGCQVWFRGATCFAGDGEPVADPQNLALQPPCARIEAKLNPRRLTVAHVGAGSHGADLYPRDGRFQIGFFDIDVPVDPSIPVPSKPVPPPTLDQIEQERQAFRAALDAMPPWTPPEGWTRDSLEEVLDSDPSCTVDAVMCRGDLCVAVSTEPSCDRSTWHARTSVVSGISVARYTWADEADGFQAVAVTLVPAEAKGDAQVVKRVNLLARLLLKIALYP